MPTVAVGSQSGVCATPQSGVCLFLWRAVGGGVRAWEWGKGNSRGEAEVRCRGAGRGGKDALARVRGALSGRWSAVDGPRMMSLESGCIEAQAGGGGLACRCPYTGRCAPASPPEGEIAPPLLSTSNIQLHHYAGQ